MRSPLDSWCCFKNRMEIRGALPPLCREGELNPHAPFSTADFESAASPSSAISACPRAQESGHREQQHNYIYKRVEVNALRFAADPVIASTP